MKSGWSAPPPAGPDRVTGPIPPDIRDWMVQLWESVLPHTSGRCYQNFQDPELPDWANAYYGDNLARLVGLKAEWDPTGCSTTIRASPTALKRSASQFRYGFDVGSNKGSVMGITRVAAVAGMACGLTLGWPLAHAAGGAVRRTTSSPRTAPSTAGPPPMLEAAIGRESDINHPDQGPGLLQGRQHVGVMSLRGTSRSARTSPVTFGAMQFQWNAETLDGQLISTQRGKCVLSLAARQGQIAFKLVKQTLSAAHGAGWQHVGHEVDLRAPTSAAPRAHRGADHRTGLAAAGCATVVDGKPVAGVTASPPPLARPRRPEWGRCKVVGGGAAVRLPGRGVQQKLTVPVGPASPTVRGQTWR